MSVEELILPFANFSLAQEWEVMKDHVGGFVSAVRTFDSLFCVLCFDK